MASMDTRWRGLQPFHTSGMTPGSPLRGSVQVRRSTGAAGASSTKGAEMAEPQTQ